MTIHRVGAMVYRHMVLYKRSLARLMEIFYWPVLDLLVWGFVTVYLQRSSVQLPHFVAYLLGALILWDVMFRSQQGVSISFLEEVWSRNLLNLFVSPLSPTEFLTATMIVSIFKVAAASAVAAFLAFSLYSFNLTEIGLSLIPFMINLVIMGWTIGIFTTAVILRFGQKAEILAWGVAFLFQPVAAVFYPVSVLPPVLQRIAAFVPASHIFEGMRDVIETGRIPIRHLAMATGLNLVYLAVISLFFFLMFREVKKRGLLVRVGE
jgi:ABC-2 type transport system permease protein